MCWPTCAHSESDARREGSRHTAKADALYLIGQYLEAALQKRHPKTHRLDGSGDRSDQTYRSERDFPRPIASAPHRCRRIHLLSVLFPNQSVLGGVLSHAAEITLLI